MLSRRRFFLTAIAVLLATALVPGCKNPDDGPQPMVMPAYPVRNLPPWNVGRPAPAAQSEPVPSKPFRQVPTPPRPGPTAPLPRQGG